MSDSLLRTPSLMYMVSLSFIGLCLVGILSVYPPGTHENLAWRKPLIGSAFSLVCILGILSVFLPKQCSRVFYYLTRGKREPARNFVSHGAFPTLKGHHPDCENFSPHVFQVGDKTFCTACTGLFLGGFAAFAGAVLYFFGEWNLSLHSPLLVWIGVLGVGCGLFQFKARRTVVRLSLNTFFVLGCFLILIGIDKLAQNVFADIFVVLLAVFWLYTRILLSHWDHTKICYTCEVESCEFR